MKKLALIAGKDLRYYGGGEKDIIGLANLLKNDYKITLFYPEGNNNLRVDYNYLLNTIDKRIELNKFKTLIFKLTEDYIPINMGGIKLLFKLKEFDVIYSMSQSIIFNMFILFMSTFYNKRFIIGIHTPYFFRKSPIGKNFLKHLFMPFYSFLRLVLIKSVKNVRVQNSTDIKSLHNLGYKGSIYVIPPHIFDTKPTIIKNNQSHFVVLFLGRLDILQKGIDLLDEIVRIVLRQNKNVLFKVVGSGEDGEKIIKNLELEFKNNFEWLGFLEDAKIPSIFNKSSLFVFPSRGENFGIALAEAQLYGLPAVAFNVMGSKDVLNKDFLGKKVPPFNTENFAKEILHYYELWKSNKILYNALKIKISAYTAEKYNNKKLLKAIKKMLG
ncbi:MAG: glycosyltransferase [Candidatus Micrarchaeaceae archaeon]